MTRKEFNKMLNDKYGNTPAQWVVCPAGTEWDGSLCKRSQIYDIVRPGVYYNIWPYVGYKQGLNNSVSAGEPIELVIK